MIEPRLITNTSDTGSLGLDHPNHGKLTSLGFVFIDYNAKELYINTGEGFESLSGADKGLRKFFKKFIRFCSHNGCMNEQSEGTPHYSFGVDHEHTRLLFTKSDGYYSYTLSYDYMEKRFVSFHSYIPQEYIYDRNHLYTIHNNGIWKHDVYDEYTTFYNDFKGCFIDFTNYIGESNNYASTDVYTDVYIDEVKNKTISFDKVHLSNSYQHTGFLNLEASTKTDINSGNAYEQTKDNTNNIKLSNIAPDMFRFSEIYNYNVSDESKIITNEDCKPEPILSDNVDYSDRSEQTYLDRILFDNYLYYRFIFSKFANAKLYIKNITTYFNKIEK